jgi:hypothetical protein
MISYMSYTKPAIAVHNNFNRAYAIMIQPISSHHPPAKETVDALFAAAAAQLSVEQTLSAQEDLYGVVRKVPEKEQDGRIPALIQILRARLGAVKLKRGTAYELAEKIDRTYVASHDFQLKFLRANKYEPAQAAEQIIKFFDMKLMLFGRDKLAKDITLDDLDEDDQNCLKNGSNQVLRTTNNRHILLCFPGLRRFKILRNELRAKYYVLMSMIESKETQIDGLTIINYAVGNCKDRTNGTGFVEQTRLLLSLPIHMAAAHHCCDDTAQYILLSAAIRLGSATHLSRFQAHFGSQLECTYKLATYGIPNGCLPLSPSDNEPILDHHLAWLRTRRIIDAVKRTAQSFHPQIIETRLQPRAFQAQHIPNNAAIAPLVPGIMQPNADDVLFGQEHKAHPGNIKMHQLMDHLQGQYEGADKQGKMKISLIVVFSMKGTGSRFLDFDGTTSRWQIVPDTVARNKVAKSIRNRRRYKATNQDSTKEYYS